MKNTEAEMNTNTEINTNSYGLYERAEYGSYERIESFILCSYCILVYVVMPIFVVWAMKVAIDAN